MERGSYTDGSSLLSMKFTQQSAESQNVYIYANRLFDPRPSDLDWNCREPMEKMAIPQLNRPFDKLYHMGIVCIPTNTCLDDSLTLLDKLAEGLLYQHEGWLASSAASANGRKVPRLLLKMISALEYVGQTRKNSEEIRLLSEY
ncbi:hypothetical protein P168DRAFT_281734 [Aspergillus campestris IBT 28561]|uniref:Uncharacterized protein n=1 Tax=Aspergillus campestris (strain IBT 28561) TaxID=1392248 RepID=A0A2I1D2G5_ASPC2|nr:uncharacterized protein P168DRAFT_281734 [Aspergillus campestris IBT 28561]PKY04083.1 hypothetical protein P168DRAFT_281734 [Aspergillus campestris IBT 28561]